MNTTTPSLERLRQEAESIQRGGAGLKLSDARLIVAREYGFASWRRLRAYARRVEAHGPGLQHPYREDVAYYEGRAVGLLASAEDGTESALAPFGVGTRP